VVPLTIGFLVAKPLLNFVPLLDFLRTLFVNRIGQSIHNLTQPLVRTIWGETVSRLLVKSFRAWSCHVYPSHSVSLLSWSGLLSQVSEKSQDRSSAQQMRFETKIYVFQTLIREVINSSITSIPRACHFKFQIYLPSATHAF
jgi:hypothetical protein